MSPPDTPPPTATPVTLPDGPARRSSPTVLPDGPSDTPGEVIRLLDALARGEAPDGAVDEASFGHVYGELRRDVLGTTE